MQCASCGHAGGLSCLTDDFTTYFYSRTDCSKDQGYIKVEVISYQGQMKRNFFCILNIFVICVYTGNEQRKTPVK